MDKDMQAAITEHNKIAELQWVIQCAITMLNNHIAH